MRASASGATLAAVLLAVCTLVAVAETAVAAAPSAAPRRNRRILYNLDGDSCMTLKKGSTAPTVIGPEDLKTIVAEIAYPGSQVDTLLVCTGAQATYYPSRVGTMRGAIATRKERQTWRVSEKQRHHNVAQMFAQGVDPYALLLAEAKRRGLEALVTFRMNDAHSQSFLRCRLWLDHPEARLGYGLNFAHAEVRDYTFRLIEEAARRYDCDGIEMDFQRFAKFFRGGTEAERAAAMSQLVWRVRTMLDQVGKRKHRRLVLAARVPADYEQCRRIGLDPITWAARGWIDFLTVSEFLYVRYDMPVRPWKERIRNVPVYACIEALEGPGIEKLLTAEKYHHHAQRRWTAGADGIYLFNFFTTRERGRGALEPPFEVLSQLGAPKE